MANARGKHIDNTHLSIDQAENRGFIHRDYIAHCLRWSHVVKRINRVYQHARILDIGCGRDVPLAKTLYSSRLIVKEYIGVDYNPHSTFDLSAFHSGKFPISTFGRVDFASDQVWFDRAADGQPLLNIRGDNGEDYFRMPNILVSFEVMEHIEPSHVCAMLKKAAECLKLAEELDGMKPRFFLSTPNFDPHVGAAGNHVNEMKHEALGWLIEDCGLAIENESGTFASLRDYKHKLFNDYKGSERLFEDLSSYYDVNYLATIFAPLYPVQARNCLWELVAAPEDYERKYSSPDKSWGPWTSSEHWEDLVLDGATYDQTKTGA